MIKLNNIDFSYNENKVLNNFTFQMKMGDRICLSGDSGSGKTTVLRLVLGLETPDKGDIIKLPNLKPAVVFQEDRLLTFKTVLENITLFGAEKTKALEILTALGLGDYTEKKPSELSGGMSRRVALARALALDFDYLILDEPFTGLDQSNIENCAYLINKVLGERPLILVTHSRTEADALNCKIVNLAFR